MANILPMVSLSDMWLTLCSLVPRDLKSISMQLLFRYNDHMKTGSTDLLKDSKILIICIL